MNLQEPTNEEKENILWEGLKSHGVPLKIVRQKFPLNPALKKFIPPCTIGQLQDYKGPYFFGASGTGKTTAAAALLSEWLKQFDLTHSNPFYARKQNNPSYFFLNYPKFIMELQDTYRGKESAYNFLDEVAAKVLLVIDDLGAEKPTEYVRQATYYLINERECNCRPTIITSNFSLDYLEENIDPRIASRIRGMCEMVELKGADFRHRKPR